MPLVYRVHMRFDAEEVDLQMLIMFGVFTKMNMCRCFQRKAAKCIQKTEYLLNTRVKKITQLNLLPI